MFYKRDEFFKIEFAALRRNERFFDKEKDKEGRDEKEACHEQENTFDRSSSGHDSTDSRPDDSGNPDACSCKSHRFSSRFADGQISDICKCGRNQYAAS